jgi:Tol biopolymer transport system component
MNSDGSHQKQLTADVEVWLGKPSWSPDGRQVVFSGVRKGSTSISKGSDIYVANADGSEVRNLTNNSDETSVRPIWSPDGRYILFQILADREASNRDDKVCAMNVDGSNVRCILKAPGCEIWGWGPDDKSISIGTDGAERWLYMVNVDCALEGRLGEDSLPEGCYSRVLLPEWSHAVYPGEWSPDGTLLLFWATDPAQGCDDNKWDCINDEVYVMGEDGTELTNLTDNDAAVFDRDPTWVR